MESARRIFRRCNKHNERGMREPTANNIRIPILKDMAPAWVINNGMSP